MKREYFERQSNRIPLDKVLTADLACILLGSGMVVITMRLIISFIIHQHRKKKIILISRRFEGTISFQIPTWSDLLSVRHMKPCRATESRMLHFRNFLVSKMQRWFSCLMMFIIYAVFSDATEIQRICLYLVLCDSLSVFTSRFARKHEPHVQFHSSWFLWHANKQREHICWMNAGQLYSSSIVWWAPKCMDSCSHQLTPRMNRTIAEAHKYRQAGN